MALIRRFSYRPVIMFIGQLNCPLTIQQVHFTGSMLPVRLLGSAILMGMEETHFTILILVIHLD